MNTRIYWNWMMGFAASSAFIAAGCSQPSASGNQNPAGKDSKAPTGHHAAHAGDAPHESPKEAVVVFKAMQDSGVEGTLTLTQHDGYVQISGEVKGLTPGKHGFHIHEFGDLRAADGTSAGGHFNPTGAPHGGPGSDHRHVGDFGNIEAGDDGVAKVDIKADGLSLSSILGRSFVVHADPDDLTSQPSGNAGARIAVGVVGLAKAE